TVIFGVRSLLVVAVCVAACVGFEALFNLIIKKEQTVGDLSAAVTGLLLALNLPANIPLWQCVVGSLFAIVIVKGLFGGIGCNPVNPAITARVFMLVAFGSMTVQAFPTVVDTVSSATPLSVGPEGAMPSLLDLFLGLNGGAIGETCVLALLLGFVYLLVRRIITWHIPVAFIGTVFVCSFFMEGMDPVRALAMILSGGLFIGAIFMATDYVTSPATPKGKLIFGIGAGLITFVIRYFGVYPEGVSFAILFMNILTPYISSWTRRKVFGVGGKKA
ncbi:MAG: RnfABCDGE type electron transport complex subunit D, partial [Lachnospiraceae bacterium]